MPSFNDPSASLISLDRRQWLAGGLAAGAAAAVGLATSLPGARLLSGEPPAAQSAGAESAKGAAAAQQTESGQAVDKSAGSKPRRQLLLLFLSGGASQLELWDPKPGVKTGGPYRAISTSIPGVHVGELLPYTSRIMHRLTVVRSVNSNIADHDHGHYALQAGRAVRGYPVIGSAVARLMERPGDPLPGYVSLRRDSPKAYTDTGDAGFLGPKYEGVRVVNCKPPENLVALDGFRPEQFAARDLARRATDERFLRGRSVGAIESYRTTFQQAESLMRRREIFDLEREAASDRERYGRHDFGQNCLLARRLLEAGVSCVRVTHFDWDAHQDNFYWHQVRCGEFDRTFVTLLDDLAERGRLDHTLVVAIGEMGRTPQINNLGGRDHWGRAWSFAMAGCGVKPGVVYGSTNDLGTEVKEGQVGIADLFHTFLTALGLDSREKYLIDGQTNPVADPAGKPIAALLA